MKTSIIALTVFLGLALLACGSRSEAGYGQSAVQQAPVYAPPVQAVAPPVYNIQQRQLNLNIGGYGAPAGFARAPRFRAPVFRLPHHAHHVPRAPAYYAPPVQAIAAPPAYYAPPVQSVARNYYRPPVQDVAPPAYCPPQAPAYCPPAQDVPQDCYDIRQAPAAYSSSRTIIRQRSVYRGGY